MMPEEINLLLKQFSELVGPANVSGKENSIVVKPASALETARVMNLALKEKISVEPLNYMIGPSFFPARDGRIILSLERMNKVLHFDGQSLCLLVEPAVTMDEIIKTVTAHGYYFPGEKCSHKRITIGESVAACFKEGEPDFKCLLACISGLEMALLDGGIATIDGSCVKEIDNYSLSYLLAGHREKVAIITGIRLKMLPERTGDYLLVAAFKQFEDVLSVLPTLADYRENLQKVIVLDNSIVSPSAVYLNNLFPGTKEHGAYALFSLEGALSELEHSAEKIADICQERDAREILIADATYQKEMVCSAFNSSLVEILADENFHEQSDFHFQDELNHQDMPYQLKALTWQTEPEIRKAYYTVK